MNNLYQLKLQIIPWLKSLQKSPKGAFAISDKGALFHPSSTQGLGFSCLAVKIAYTINALDEFSQQEQQQWAEYIKSFQTKTGLMSGYFEDHGLLNDLDGLRLKSYFIQGPFKYLKNFEVRRAETRQALGSLLCLGQKSNNPITHIPKNKTEALKYFNSLPWKNPWAAGSHLGHLLFFLKYNKEHFEIRDDGEIEILLWKELGKIQNKNNGAWYKGNPSPSVMINGAMKVLIAYNLYHKEIEWPSKLIDLCLETITKSDGCHLLDQIFVLHSCLKYSNHRFVEIKQFAEKLNQSLKKHHNSDGGFSFYQGKSQTGYYGKKISKGLQESDLHGTHLFTWTLALTHDILNEMKGCEWKAPIT